MALHYEFWQKIKNTDMKDTTLRIWMKHGSICTIKWRKAGLIGETRSGEATPRSAHESFDVRPGN